jgi:hypothetical protein
MIIQAQLTNSTSQFSRPSDRDHMGPLANHNTKKLRSPSKTSQRHNGMDVSEEETVISMVLELST